jgi:hypothetical protein
LNILPPVEVLPTLFVLASVKTSAILGGEEAVFIANCGGGVDGVLLCGKEAVSVAGCGGDGDDSR